MGGLAEEEGGAGEGLLVGGLAEHEGGGGRKGARGVEEGGFRSEGCGASGQ